MHSYTVNSEHGKSSGDISRLVRNVQGLLHRCKKKQQLSENASKRYDIGWKIGKKRWSQSLLSEEQDQNEYFVASTTEAETTLLSVKFSHKEEKYAAVNSIGHLLPTCGDGPHGTYRCPLKCVLCNFTKKSVARSTPARGIFILESDLDDFKKINLAVSIIPNYTTLQYRLLNQAIERMVKKRNTKNASSSTNSNNFRRDQDNAQQRHNKMGQKPGVVSRKLRLLLKLC